eukprot:TRINITY_DN20958_c0_g4_i1.p4 TRINITY_DN20958_c0_g4~~TRINITY_DN20958_c0_g4_i1.p4  ORF type:complete len:208 (+),score=-17.79 TRINITY_DN20958_c0_g4_i1:5-628(+)
MFPIPSDIRLPVLCLYLLFFKNIVLLFVIHRGLQILQRQRIIFCQRRGKTIQKYFKICIAFYLDWFFSSFYRLFRLFMAILGPEISTPHSENMTVRYIRDRRKYVFNLPLKIYYMLYIYVHYIYDIYATLRKQTTYILQTQPTQNIRILVCSAFNVSIRYAYLVFILCKEYYIHLITQYINTKVRTNNTCIHLLQAILYVLKYTFTK